ncbi:MAG: DUF5695 domain-containing protein [Candidatus Saccharicenans sp.]
MSSGGFTLEFSGRGLTSLKRTADAYPTNYVLTGNPIGDVVVTYRLAGEADFKHLRQASLISPGQATDGTAVTAPAAAGASASAPPAAPVSIDNRSGANLCPDEPASKGGAFDFTPSAPLSPGFSPSDPASSARSSRLDGFPCFIPHDSTGPASTVVGQDLASPPLPLFSSFSSSCSSSVLPASLTPPAPAAPQAFTYRINPPYIPFITGVKVSASTLSDRAAQQSARALSALYDDLPIIDSKSRSTGYFSFSPKKGTVEWVQYDFPQPATATAIEIYWLDDSALNGPYQAPVRWRLLYRDARGNYLPVKNTSPYTTALDRFNRLTFEPVTTTSLRLEVEQAPGYTAGLYEWRVETDQEKLRRQAWEEESRQVARQIKVESSFKLADALLWTVSVENLTDRPLEIADLGLPLPFNTQYGWNKDETYNLRVIRHFLVAGNGSFVFCQRTNAEPPYLLMIPVGAAAFEYFDDGGGRGIFCPYLHSAWAFEQVKKEGGRWRFQTTSVQLSPHGQSGDRLSYTFKFMWAEDGYQSVRDLLYEEGKFDVQVVPGMVVPENLEALVAVRTKHRDIKLEAEFPSQTTIEEVQPIKNFGESAVVKKRKGQTVGAAANKTEADVRTDSSYRLFRIRFSRLGENIVTIKYGSPEASLSKGTTAGESVAITAAGDDGAGSMPLEFFVTEDLETVIKKRANFLTTRQQHQDPSKWYYGVYSDWDMKNRVLRSPDDRDGLPTWLVDACDDAGNARPAYVASKNVYLPVQAEVASVDLYIKHYLWGGMQQTDDEPYPFAIYGIPNWKVNRDSPDPGRNGQKHIWRIYDYPHIVLLYHRMYQVARLHPEIKTELAADEYLRRAYRTAIAYFTVPLEVEGWSAYETPTMNEIVMNDLLRALEREGWKKEEAELRQHWEKKVRHFVEDDPYLFGSEFAFDSTGFEATGAMARYAMEKVVEGEMKRKEERSLWPGGERGDKRAEFENLKKTEAKSPGEGLVGTTTSKGIAPVKMVQTRLLAGEAGPELQAGEGVEARPGWERARVEKFMEKQVRLNVAARGWLETAYYYLGSDYRAGGGLRYTLSYMSPMGGWSILDYGLNWAGARAHLFDYLRLGYASYLSSWALVNSGRAETGYGFWFPGEENDGGAGGGFEPMARARGWLGKWIERGAWYYSAEEDVGYCGAIRTAATVVANDPVFGLVALGGKLEDKGDRIEVVPRDGLGVRFHLMASPERRLHVEFEQGRLAKGKAVVIKKDLSEIILQVEGRREEGRAKIDGAKMAEVELVVSGLGLEYKAYDRAGQEIKGERLADGSIRFHSPSTDLVVLTRDLVVLTR